MARAKGSNRYEPHWVTRKVFTADDALAVLAKVTAHKLTARSFIGDVIDTHRGNELIERRVSPEIYLSQRICTAVAWSRGIQKDDARESASDLLSQFSEIARQCQKLQRDMEFRKFEGWESRNLWEWLPEKYWSALNVAAIHYPENAVRDALIGLENLRTWAEFAAVKAGERVRPQNKNRHSGKLRHLKQFIGSLFGIWIEMYGTIPSHVKSGEFAAFCSAIFSVIPEFKNVDWTTQVRPIAKSLGEGFAK